MRFLTKGMLIDMSILLMLLQYSNFSTKEHLQSLRVQRFEGLLTVLTYLH